MRVAAWPDSRVTFSKHVAAPVVDDEEGKQTGAGRVKPPYMSFGADEGEEEGDGVEDDVGFAVLG